MIGIKTKTAFMLICLTFSGAAALNAQERMRAGMWEITTSLDGDARGGSHTACYTPAMVALANGPVKTIREATEKEDTRNGCAMKDFKMEGNSISTTRVCRSSTLVVSSTYALSAFETVATSTERSGTRVVHMKGRRIGDCK
jgi:hypothetical protein